MHFFDGYLTENQAHFGRRDLQGSARTDAMLRGDGVDATRGQRALGCPIGSHAYVVADVRSQVDSALRILGVLDTLLLDTGPPHASTTGAYAPDERATLITFCVSARVRHLTRLLPPDGAELDAQLRRFHDATLDAHLSPLALHAQQPLPAPGGPIGAESHIPTRRLAALASAFGGHGIRPLASRADATADAFLASHHDAALYGSWAAVWCYMRAWFSTFRDVQIAQTGALAGGRLPYRTALRGAFSRICAARTAAGLHPHRALLPGAVSLPGLHSLLDDGELSAPTIPLGSAYSDGGQPVESSHYDKLWSLDLLDSAAHPYASRPSTL